MQEVHKYINDHYQQWLDHAQFHCNRKGIPDEANDVLNEVLVYLLRKSPKKLLKLRYNKAVYGKFPDGEPYMEMDIYVLAAIKINVTSPTSPYQSRYKSRYDKSKIESDVDFSRMHVIDYEAEEEENDNKDLILKQVQMVRDIYEKIYLSDHAKEIFEYKFFHGLSYSEWPGCESKKYLYETYNKIIQMIKEKINGRSLL